jgi:hypothetical protein
MKFVRRKGWVENKCPGKDESTKNMLHDVLQRVVEPLRIVICATYRGHLAWLFYILCVMYPVRLNKWVGT